MRWGRRASTDPLPDPPPPTRESPLLSIVVPAWGTEPWLPACLDSALASTWTALEVVVVDDGSPDRCGEIAQEYAARDPRVRVVTTPNGGLGAARNVGARHATGALLGFLDSDDVVPPDAWAVLVGSLLATGSDFAVGAVARWEAGVLDVPGWQERLHSPARAGVVLDDHPEVLGDVFAWNKVFRRSFWDAEGLSWPERVRYEDQPTTTEAYLRGRFDVLEDVVYHWRIRDDGSSITQQRGTVEDLRDRWATKRSSLDSVQGLGSPAVQDAFLGRVLAGDLPRYFAAVPAASSEWWDLLVAMVRDLWAGRSLVDVRLLPRDRLVGWLVEQDRRDDAVRVVGWLATLDGPAPRVGDGAGGQRLDVPADVLDVGSVDPRALRV